MAATDQPQVLASTTNPRGRTYVFREDRIRAIYHYVDCALQKLKMSFYFQEPSCYNDLPTRTLLEICRYFQSQPGNIFQQISFNIDTYFSRKLVRSLNAANFVFWRSFLFSMIIKYPPLCLITSNAERSTLYQSCPYYQYCYNDYFPSYLLVFGGFFLVVD